MGRRKGYTRIEPPHTKAEIERAHEILRSTPKPKLFDPPNYERIWANAVIRDDFKYRQEVFQKRLEIYENRST